MRTAKLILNPTAGRGRAAREAEHVRAQLKDHGVDADLVLTSGPGNATDLAQGAREEGYPLVIAAGGDGTVNEVVNGMMRGAGRGTGGALGIVPLGTGNDFIKTVGIPKAWSAACAIIGRGRVTQTDVGRLDNHHFVNLAGIGFDAQVNLESRSIRWGRGTALYALALGRTMLRHYRTPRVEIELDGVRTTQHMTLLAVGNGRCAGGGFWLTPNARHDDGVLDICIADRLSRLGMLALIPHVMRGTHVHQKPVRMARARRIVVTSEEPLPVQADGEIIYSKAQRIEVELMPGRLDVCA